jgi:hypothetical protein
MSAQTALSQSIIGATIQLAFRIAFVWALGILLAVTVRAMLPDDQGFTWTNERVTRHIISFSRLGFWTCIWAAVTVTVLVVIRAMLNDFGLGSAR